MELSDKKNIGSLASITFNTHCSPKNSDLGCNKSIFYRGPPTPLDNHWDDLHRLLPGSSEYLGKEVVVDVHGYPPEERGNLITKQDDYLLRARAVVLNQGPNMISQNLYSFNAT